MNFTHLHVHTEYSLLDGAIRIKDLVKKVKDNQMTSVAITDHGNMFGAIEFYKECISNNIKPIIGCEVYVAPRSRFEKKGKIDTEPNHLILLAMNDIGYHNLMKLCSIGYTEGFYYKPRIDMEVLEKYNEGLICLSACLASKVAMQIVANDIAGAKETVSSFVKIFGKDRYFLELQDNKLREQILVNQNLITISKEFGIGVVATNDCHYLNSDDYYMHEVMLCIQTRKTMKDDDRMSFKTNEFYVKTKEEMKEAFKYIPEAIENTQKIADMCNLTINFGTTILPEFKIDENITHLEYFKRMCYEGLKKRYDKERIEKAKERLDYEISVIDKMGYIDYFLIVQDFINYAKSVGIGVGPGRGSGAGSIAAYAIGITDIDPLKFNLIFERFLNPERVSMPDFDVDFCYERRGEVIDYVTRKYGKDHVAQIITFGTMAARAAIRDVGRALDISYQKIDTVSKMVPHTINMTIDKALEENKELRQMYEIDEEIREVIDLSKKIEGLARHASTHAAGVVITKNPVGDYVPLYENSGMISTQYTMTLLEELGLLKMDFLGLRTLTVISDTIKLVEKNYGIKFSFDKEYNDKEVFKMLSDGNTEGVFQLESKGIKRVIKELKPDSIEDIIVVLSLYRPGPMDQIPRYIENKRRKTNIIYTHKALEPILKDTYGCMVYQEQVMQIFRELAGYSFGRADLVRRAMSKKKIQVMNEERGKFISGALKNGIDEESANKIFDEMSDFAKYAFNKSHAAAYAVVAYQTAYLKKHYPHEFFAATMNSLMGDFNKIPEYISECKKLGIKVLKPDINESYTKFAVVNQKIRFALVSIKNVGEGAINYILNERNRNGKFVSFIDFVKRTAGDTVNKKCIESLIRAGCFDEIEKNYSRFDLLESYESIVDSIVTSRRNNYENQINLFDGGANQKQEEIIIRKSNHKATKKELLDMEKEMIGLYISGHPLDEYKEYIDKVSTVTLRELNSHLEFNIQDGEDDEYEEKNVDYDGKQVIVCGIVTKSKLMNTRTGKQMIFADLEDMYGSAELVVFPKLLEQFSSLLAPESIIKVSGKVNIKEGEKAKILVNDVQKISKQEKIYIRMPKDKFDLEDRVIEAVKNLPQECKGNVPVYLYFDGTNKLKVIGRAFWLTSEKNVIEKLETMFGKENVKVK